jgi:hypothetical protein
MCITTHLFINSKIFVVSNTTLALEVTKSNEIDSLLHEAGTVEKRDRK